MLTLWLCPLDYPQGRGETKSMEFTRRAVPSTESGKRTRSVCESSRPNGRTPAHAGGLVDRIPA